MVRKSRKLQRQVAKERAQLRHAADMEKDTIYWIVFIPKTAPVATDKKVNIWDDPWRIRVENNPDKNPKLIDDAIRIFEINFNVKSWKEIAVRYHMDSVYFP